MIPGLLQMLITAMLQKAMKKFIIYKFDKSYVKLLKIKKGQGDKNG